MSAASAVVLIHGGDRPAAALLSTGAVVRFGSPVDGNCLILPASMTAGEQADYLSALGLECGALAERLRIRAYTDGVAP